MSGREFLALLDTEMVSDKIVFRSANWVLRFSMEGNRNATKEKLLRSIGIVCADHRTIAKVFPDVYRITSLPETARQCNVQTYCPYCITDLL